MQYTDFRLRLSRRADGRLRADAQCDEGEGACTVDGLPPTASLLADLDRAVTAARSDGGRDRDLDPDTGDAAPASLRALGVRLYAALFRGDVQSLFEETLAVARTQLDVGVRIRLSIDADGEGMAELWSLPWELLARDPSEVPLALRRSTALVRSPAVRQSIRPRPLRKPLHILFVPANPGGTRPLDLKAEQEEIEAELRNLLDVRVSSARGDWSDVRRRLANEDPHVLHFMGHGDFDERTGEGALIFTGPGGGIDRVSSQELGTLLTDERALRLVFLNACRSAATGARPGTDPFRGVGPALLQAGVPAVVGMQFPISDPAAIAFARTFYESLVDGHPVEAAVAEGRKELSRSPRAEWATPVLYLRAKDGVLFAPEAAAAPTPPPAAATAPAVPAAPAGEALEVFLAAGSDATAKARRLIVTGLRERGIQVHHEVPPPFGTAEHEAHVRGLVSRADLCVHVLGDRPGMPLEDGDGRESYAEAQLAIACESARSQLVLLPEALDVESIADPAYGAAVRQLEARPRGVERLEIVRTGTPQMGDAVLAKCRQLEEARRAAARPPALTSALLDLQRRDIEFADDLTDYLSRRSIRPVWMPPARDDSPTATRVGFEQSLREHPLFIVLFGHARQEWVASRLVTAAQYVTTHGLSTSVAVYVAPPSKPPASLRFLRLYRNVVTSMDGFDAGAVDRLLERAAEDLA